MAMPHLDYRFTPRIPAPPKEPQLATISESIIAAAHEGIEAQPSVSDIEKAARAMVVRMGFDPDAGAFHGALMSAGAGLSIMPNASQIRPLWTFFTQEAEAALSAVHK
jgi:hypothetical protein